jgi:hypothetical protein
MSSFFISLFLLPMQEEGVNITANSLHPGPIMTNLLRFHSVINSNTLIYLTCFWFPYEDLFGLWGFASGLNLLC